MHLPLNCKVGSVVFRIVSLIVLILVSGYTVTVYADKKEKNDKENKNYRVVVTPDDVTLEIGQTQQFSAVVEYKDGQQEEANVDWSLTGREIGEIDENGLFTALARGTVHVVGTYERKSGRARVTVRGDSVTGPVKERLRVVIEPGSANTTPGDSVQFSACLMDTAGNTKDTTFVWSLSNDECGTLSEEGLFTAEMKGTSFVLATAGDLSGKARVTVRDSASWNNRKVGCLTIVPEDTVITPGDVIQYRAVFVYFTGEAVDTTAEWKVMGNYVGDITEDGIFTAVENGTALVRAKIKRYLAMTHVMVADPSDTTSADSDTIRVRFRHENGDTSGTTTGQEGQTVFTFSGLPWPLSMLNGGKIIFPPGSVEDNITIDVTMPNFTQYENDSTVSYGDLILNGVTFDVYVGDSCISPYYFNPPANLVLPYDSTMLADLGMTPDDLWMFFYTAEEALDSTGIHNVVVDPVNNLIYAEVTHFSTLAIASRSSQNASIISEATDLREPSRLTLYANYPNPFNPETLIRFDLSGEKPLHIRLSIFNLLGQEVRVLVNKILDPGMQTLVWDGKDEQGNTMVSGIYIYRLRAGQTVVSRRMVFLR